MPFRAKVVFMVVWLVSLLAIGVMVRAQTTRVVTPDPSPVILSGADVGFRVEGHAGAVPAGRLVVKVDGKWVEPIWHQKIIE